LDDGIRAQALVGLSEQADDYREQLVGFARSEDTRLRDEALRALVNVKLSPDQRIALEEVGHRRTEARPLVARVLGKSFATDRPAAKDIDAWLKRLEGPADADAGRRVFFHTRLAGCFRCHRVEGRGQEVGPDLSTIGRSERRHIVESILQPSALVAPHYQVWQIETDDGKVRTGMLIRTYLDEYT